MSHTGRFIYDSKKNRYNSINSFEGFDGQITKYGPNVVSLHQKKEWEWFKLWVVLIIVTVIIWCVISIAYAPLGEFDLMGYVNVDANMKKSTNSSTSSARLNPRSDYSKMSPNELRGINLNFIPTLTDYSEMDF